MGCRKDCERGAGRYEVVEKSSSQSEDWKVKHGVNLAL
jgi:hypothetical protein